MHDPQVENVVLKNANAQTIIREYDPTESKRNRN